FKGHDMLAPFTAGWQTTDLHPLVIDKSEVPCLMRWCLPSMDAQCHVFFTNSGSEANDSQYLIFDRKCFLQVKLVWYYNNALGRPNKKKFIARSKAYVVSWINLNLCQSFWIAAFIAEPVMGAGGVIPPPKTYFEKVSLEVSLVPLSVLETLIQAVVKKYDILFIADELVSIYGEALKSTEEKVAELKSKRTQ
ncbi:hypothetical protein BHE74_00022419, partial [Ensete ventricosum]